MARIIIKTMTFTYLRTQRLVCYANISLSNHYKPRANIAHERDATGTKTVGTPTNHSLRKLNSGPMAKTRSKFVWRERNLTLGAKARQVKYTLFMIHLQ